LVVGACRELEVSLEHHLYVTLHELETNGTMVCHIHVDGLNKMAITKMISNVLDVSLEACASLADLTLQIMLRYTPMYTVWTEALLETESGKTCGRYYKRPAIHLSGLRDCKTLLAGDAPLGLGSGYEDLCNKGSTDQRTQKTMIED
jgi:hypothetical protein